MHTDEWHSILYDDFTSLLWGWMQAIFAYGIHLRTDAVNEVFVAIVIRLVLMMVL